MIFLKLRNSLGETFFIGNVKPCVKLCNIICRVCTVSGSFTFSLCITECKKFSSQLF